MHCMGLRFLHIAREWELFSFVQKEISEKYLDEFSWICQWGFTEIRPWWCWWQCFVFMMVTFLEVCGRIIMFSNVKNLSPTSPICQQHNTSPKSIWPISCPYFTKIFQVEPKKEPVESPTQLFSSSDSELEGKLDTSSLDSLDHTSAKSGQNSQSQNPKPGTNNLYNPIWPMWLWWIKYYLISAVNSRCIHTVELSDNSSKPTIYDSYSWLMHKIFKSRIGWRKCSKRRS